MEFFMVSFVVFFLIGDFFLQHCSTLPVQWVGLMILCVFFILKVIFTNRCGNQSLNFFMASALAVLLGYVYSNWYAHLILKHSLPAGFETEPVTCIGYVASLPVNSAAQTRFVFQAVSIQKGGLSQPIQILINISWRNSSFNPHVGDKLELNTRLKRIHGLASPGAFDYEAIMLEKGIGATGYVLNGSNRFLSHYWYNYPIDQLREAIRTRLQVNLPPTQTAHWLEALIIGEKENIAADEWKVLRNTGTNHLMAIGGLHIGLIAGFIHFLFGFMWRRSAYLTLCIPSTEAGAIAAIVMALIYSALAGFSLPTERACIMLVSFMVYFIWRKPHNAWSGWSIALLLVLILNPLALLSDSFWLSFSTLALITYGMSARVKPGGWWWKYGRIQWLIGIGLMPISILIFHEASFISFAANTIAIPWLACLILPLCLISTGLLFIYAPAAKFGLWLADFNLHGLWYFLQSLSKCHGSIAHLVMPNPIIFFMTFSAVLLLLAPIGIPGRLLSFVWLMPLIFYSSPHPRLNAIWFSVLDVGQGLSVVVQTKSHVLLYDAGPKLGPGSDAGENIVVPFLLSKQIKKIDMLVVSHGDNDHIGGVESVAELFRIKQVKSSVPDKLQAFHADFCRAGDHWEWDGVIFTFLYPTSDDLQHGNDSSCVLRIDNGEQSILLPGDIQKMAEKKLLLIGGEDLKVSMLVAPHHGSKTSAILGFVNKSHPGTIVYATGYHNRYRFPNPSVVKLYEQLGATSLNTAEEGTIEWVIDEKISTPLAYRKIHRHYWQTPSLND